MKTHQLIMTLALCIITLFTYAQDKSISTEKSSLSWTGKAAFNAYSLTGTLKVKRGTLTIENDSIKALKITIDMKSLDHENSDLKAHLSGKDFFEVKTYIEATYMQTQPIAIINGEALIIGKMNIKSITKTECFIIKINEDYSSFSFDISIDRTSYGVKFNSPSFFKKMKENAIADEFKLKGDLRLE